MIMATNQMGERYSDAKLNVSWPSGSRYADSNFPALLDRVEQAVKAVKA